MKVGCCSTHRVDETGVKAGGVEAQLASFYTAGHGAFESLDDLVAKIRASRIPVTHVVDVRSVPFSRYQPSFNRPTLRDVLPSFGIGYVYMGDTLGGFPPDGACRLPDGRVDYEAYRRTSLFAQGIARLERARSLGFVPMLFCSEADPSRCHRSRMIGVHLHMAGHALAHLHSDGRIETHSDLEHRMEPQADLFGLPAVASREAR